MRREAAACLIAGLVSLGVTGAVSAHHSFAQFDRDTENLISGEVVRWAFNNPHTWLYMNVENDDGTVTLWSFEGSGPINLLRRGINGSTFEPGDELTLMYCPLRDGRPGGHMGWVRLGDGSYIDPSDGGCYGDEDTITKWQGWLEQGISSSAEVDNG